jgi:homoserine O-acetyltransferase
MSSVLRHPPLAAGWIDAPHRRLELGDFALESGEVIRDAHLGYVVHGDPRNLPDRAVLITTSIGGTHHRLDFLIGPGNAIDTQQLCVIAVDALGNGISSSPSNAHASQRESSFPRFTIRDMVASQRVLLDYLGVARLRAVIGASMGGMQALQWGVSHPDRMAGLAAITPLARPSRWSQLMNELTRRALFADESCSVPRSREAGLELWVPLTQLVMSGTPASVEDFFAERPLLDWLRQRQHRLLEDGSMDPFDWCHQTWAYDAHDVG